MSSHRATQVSMVDVGGRRHRRSKFAPKVANATAIERLVLLAPIKLGERPSYPRPEFHMTKFANILETVGHTPIVKINKLAPAGVNLYVKVEAFNPLGSVK